MKSDVFLASGWDIITHTTAFCPAEWYSWAPFLSDGPEAFFSFLVSDLGTKKVGWTVGWGEEDINVGTMIYLCLTVFCHIYSLVCLSDISCLSRLR